MTPQEKARISIVIPARNEEKTIGGIVKEALTHAAEVIVVDGHSHDETAKRAEAAGARVVYDNRRGKGEAIRCVIPHIKTPLVVFMDADGSHLAEDIPKLTAPLLAESCDHVTGSRLLGGSSELHGGFDEFLRLAGSSFITACINWRFGVKLSDSQNGFRALKTEVLRRLGLRENITTIEQEMIIRTLALGYKMDEVPAHEYKRQFGVSSISLRKVWFQYGWSLVWNLFFRKV